MEEKRKRQSYVSGRMMAGWTCVGRESHGSWGWLVPRESGREGFGALQHDGGAFRE